MAIVSALSAEDSLTAGLVAASEEAGRAILDIYAGDFAREEKPDRSPVTAADLAAEAILLTALHRLAPGIPVIAEEASAAQGLPEGAAPTRFFLVDPLDGTKEFIARNGEFTVNIALIERGVPCLGIVHLPVLGETFFAGSGGAFRRDRAGGVTKIAARALPPEGAVMMISRSHEKRGLVEGHVFPEPIAARSVAGSSLKFCRLAEGKADLYPRFGPTMEWDIAAGHAVLAAAGGSVTTLTGAELRYGKSADGYRNPPFIARGRR